MLPHQTKADLVVEFCFLFKATSKCLDKKFFSSVVPLICYCTEMKFTIEDLFSKCQKIPQETANLFTLKKKKKSLAENVISLQ